MLELLRIKDLALIEDAELEFAPGMNALTGETGAGKSFIVRAIDFLTGEPMSADMVRPGKDKAVVEAVFVLPGEGGPEDLVIRRELSAETGRSRVFVNDRLGSLDTLRELKAGLVLHTSQHGQQKLLQPAYQARILDAFLPDQNLLTERDQALAEVAARIQARAELAAKVAELSRQREFLEFQRAEISKVAPEEGEEDALLARKEALKGRERLDEAKNRALEALLGEFPLAAQLGELARTLGNLAAFDETFAAEREAAEDYRHRLAALEGRVRRLSASEGGEDDIEAIEARLFELAKLRRKLGRGLDEIVHLGREVEENLSFLDSCALDDKRLVREEAEAAGRLAQVLERLNAARRQAAADLSERLGRELAGLGFSEHARVEFSFEPFVLYASPNGEGDLSELRARLLWVPNPGQPPRPLDKIASGGELSRFLLALTGLRAESAQPTLIFDEVDAGIGGHTLTRVGERLTALAGRQQMILITHWPQLARLAGRHFLVRKDVIDGQTYTGCARLSAPEIDAELSRMSGGAGL